MTLAGGAKIGFLEEAVCEMRMERWGERAFPEQTA